MSTQPATVVELDDHRFNLALRVREFIADQSLDGLDDEALIDLFMNSLSPAEIREALRATLPSYFCDARRHGFQAAARRSRWNGMDAAKVQALRERVFDEWVNTADGRKRFGACDAADIRYLADQRSEQAKSNLVWAKKFDSLAKAMKRAKVATVADLGDEAVRLIANA